MTIIIIKSIFLISILRHCIFALEKPTIIKFMDMMRLHLPSSLTESSRTSTSFYTDQALDHFDKYNNKTWDQRYFLNDEFFTDKRNAPIFLLIGGETRASISWMKYGAWYDYAKKVGALMIQLEHRFYGESHPTENLSLDNLKYLTSQQALEDIVQFIGFIKEKYNLRHNKWITFGCSYPGSLSLWMRSLYPDLIAGAISTSAPVEAKADFEDYLAVVDQTMDIHDPSCTEIIVEVIKEIQDLLSFGLKGREEVAGMFNICEGWSGCNDKDVGNFFMSLLGMFFSSAQYDFLQNSKLAEMCSHISNKTSKETNMEKLATMFKSIYFGTCANIEYRNLLDYLRNEEWAPGETVGFRQWTFQTCNEFGWYQTGNHWGSFLPLDFFLERCKDIYGPKFTKKLIYKKIQNTNLCYGGKDPSLSNAIITHGSIDPWYPQGILKHQSKSVKAFFIRGTSHCYDFNSPNSFLDTPEVIRVRKNTLEHIKKWIS